MANAAVRANRGSQSSSRSSSNDAGGVNHLMLLETPRRWRPARRSRPMRLLQSLRRALPVLTPRCVRAAAPCRITASLQSSSSSLSRIISPSGSDRHSRRVTGTLFGFRRGRAVLSLQDTPRCLPALVVELALLTHTLLRELSNPTGARIVLEAKKRAAGGEGSSRRRGHGERLLEEPVWTMFCNGKKTGYAVRREASGDDMAVMETLRAVSMGAGVLPGRSDDERPEAEVAYMRGCFDHIVGSRDSESLYMVGPQGGDGPELAIFFVRI